MRQFLLRPILVMLLAAARPALAEAPFVRVFILSGQSNMAGGSDPVALTGSVDDVWFDSCSATTPAGSLQTGWLRLPMPAEGGTGNQAGAGEVFAARYPGDRIALLKVSQGATGITYWNTPGNTGYERLMERIATVRARLDAQLAASAISGYTFAGFLWMQGEDEMNTTIDRGSQSYFANLRRLLDAVRAASGVPDLPSGIGRTANYYSPETLRPGNAALPGSGNLRDTAAGSRDYTLEHEFVDTGLLRGANLFQGYGLMVRAAQMLLGRESDHHSAWAESDDLPLVDYFHFPTGEEGKVTLGRRLARALLRAKGESLPDELRVHAGPHRWAHPGTVEFAPSLSGDHGEPLTVGWELITGPVGSVTFSPVDGLHTSVTLTTPGTYALRVNVHTPTRRHNHIVNVIVLAADANLPAYGYAEPIYVDRPLIRVPIGATLLNPDGDPLSFHWTRQLGVSTVEFEDATARDTHARFHAAGGYTLRLAVSDGVARDDGNSSGWVLLPVMVGTGGGAEANTYAARFSFDEADRLIGELNFSNGSNRATTTLPVQISHGVTQSPEARVGTGAGAFDAAAYQEIDITRFINAFPHGSHTALSFAAWIQPASPGNGTQVIYDQGGTTSGNPDAFTVRLHNGQLQAAWRARAGGETALVEAPAPAAGAWAHIAAVADGATHTLTLFVNGAAVASLTHATALVATGNMADAAALGARLNTDAFNSNGSGATDFYTGLIDEARVYMVAIDADTIDALVAAGTAPDPDSDRDDLPDAWETRYFSDIEAQGPLDDPHRTGLPLIFHYAMATDPRAFPAGALSGPEWREIDGAPWLALRSRRSNTAAGVQWSTLASSDLASPVETWPALVPNDADVFVEVLDPDLEGDGAAALIEWRVRLTGPRLFLTNRVTFE